MKVEKIIEILKKRNPKEEMSVIFIEENDLEYITKLNTDEFTPITKTMIYDYFDEFGFGLIDFREAPIEEILEQSQEIERKLEQKQWIEERADYIYNNKKEREELC